MSTLDPRRLDQAADPARVVRDFLAAGKRSIAAEQWSEAAATLRAALELCARMRDTDHAMVEILEGLAQALWRGVGPAEAMPVQRRLVALCESGGPARTRLALSLAALARMCEGVGRAAEAESLIARAVALVEAGGDDDAPTLAHASTIGRLLADWNHREAAEKLLRKALRGLTVVLGDDEPEVAEVAVTLADLLVKTDREEEALELLATALPVLEAEETPRDRLGIGLLIVGRARLSERDYAGAHARFQRAEAVYLALRGPTSAEATGCRYHRALTWRDEGQNDVSRVMFERVLKEAIAAFGPDHTAVASIAETYAELLDTMGLEDEAAEMWARVRAIRGDEDEEEEDEGEADEDEGEGEDEDEDEEGE